MNDEPIRISVFGLGYVGAVSAACLAKQGHRVIGVDVNPVKVRMIASGTSPVVEKGLNEMMGAMAATGRLTATADSAEAIAGSDVSLICVGTPSRANGSLDLRYIDGWSVWLDMKIIARRSWSCCKAASRSTAGARRAELHPGSP